MNLLPEMLSYSAQDGAPIAENPSNPSPRHCELPHQKGYLTGFSTVSDSKQMLPAVQAISPFGARAKFLAKVARALASAARTLRRKMMWPRIPPSRFFFEGEKGVRDCEREIAEGANFLREFFFPKTSGLLRKRCTRPTQTLGMVEGLSAVRNPCSLVE